MTNVKKVSDAAFRLAWAEKTLVERIYRNGEASDEVAKDMHMTTSEARMRLGRAFRKISDMTGIDDEIVEELVCFI